MNLGTLMALCIIAIILSLSLKNRNPEISAIIGIAISLVIIFMCISKIGKIVDTLDKISNYMKIDNTYIVILLKLIGIAYICEFASGISKDAGYSSVSTQIELMGKLTMLFVSIPVLMQVIDTILGMM